MKKFLLLLILGLFPLVSVKAIDYDIKHYYIEAQIKDNGDMDVKEAIYLKGTYNGYERDILYEGIGDELYNATDIENIKVYGKTDIEASENVFTDQTLTEFTEVATAQKGNKNLFTISDIYDGYRITMYQPANNKMNVFFLSYTVKDVAILHNDVAELNWNFIGNGFEDDIADLKIKVYLPKSDDSSYFRLWAASGTNLAGEIEKINNEGAYAYTKNLDAYDPVTIRLTFNKDLVNSSLITKKRNREAFTDILEEEQVKADEANALRKEIRQKYWTGIIITGVFYLALIGTWVYVYLVHDKERKAQFNLKYNREFIDDYNVEVIDYLMHKNITSNAMSASIMNLIYKKNIQFTELPEEKKKEYEFTLVNRDNLNETENILVDFLFTKVGSGDKFTTKELKSYASSTKTCDTFMTSYTKWKRAVTQDGENEKFFEDKKAVGMGVVFLILGILVQIINGSLGVETLLCYTTGLVGVIFLLYTIFSNKKTEKGIEHYAKWQAFRNFLDDFGTFELKELPEIVLWDRYLVYATIFGLADKVQKAMNVHIKEIDFNDSYYPIFIYNNINIGHTINSTVSSAISGAQAAISRENATSSMSSGSGFGGGFSSGGGFGGGGGGGRGF